MPPRRPKRRPVVSSSSSSSEESESSLDDRSSPSADDEHETSVERGEGGELANLFHRLNTYVRAGDRNKDMIFRDLKKAPKDLQKAMFDVLAEKKDDLAPLLDARADIVKKLNSRSEKLDNMLFDCLAGAELGPHSPEPGDTETVSDGQYKFQLQAIKIKHTEMLEELEQSRGQAERVIDNMVEEQIPFRPISKEDHQRMIATSTARYSGVEEAIKKSTVNAVMLINNKCLDARRRRRNFTKETTEVLMEWFEAHINHPYPTDEEKNALAEHCNITVQQITNWFGNRRVRQKRQADRPLQPPSSPKKRDNGGPRNKNHLKGNRGPARAAQQRRETRESSQSGPDGPRQLLAMPDQMQQMPPTQSLPPLHSFHMDQFEPQGMSHGSLLMPDHYQMMDESSMNGSQEALSMEQVIGDKSYTAL